jgi:hypothetical protein
MLSYGGRIRYLNNLKTKLKYALQLRKSSYLEILSLKERNVCPMTLKNT